MASRITTGNVSTGARYGSQRENEIQTQGVSVENKEYPEIIGTKQINEHKFESKNEQTEQVFDSTESFLAFIQDDSCHAQKNQAQVKRLIIDCNFIINGKYSSELLAYINKFPSDLTVHGDLDISHCANLRQLPNNLTVHGDLDISHCANLRQLPGDLTVHGDLDISHCASLRQLPNSLTVLGDLDISHCASLRQLPNSLTVLGNLTLSNCIRLRQLPDNLTVYGDLDISHCTSLRQLPDDLLVHGGCILAQKSEIKVYKSNDAVYKNASYQVYVQDKRFQNLSKKKAAYLKCSSFSILFAIPD